MQFTEVHQKLAKPVYKAIPKIAEKAGKKWEWSPKPGEFFLCKTEYMDQGKTIQYDRLMLVPLEFRIEVNVYTGQSLIINNERISLGACVPLLEWQKIKEILEGMGYTVKLRDRYNCGIYTDKLGVGRSASTWQEAIQKAVLALAEKLEARKEP